jgi:glycosyltransferase involved in cell wall biosynthesis
MNQPVVSVLMAVYNTDRYLAQAVESILNQTFRDFELLIIDDGSSDHSLAILQHYATQDDRIRLTHRENRGIPQTRNELLAQAKGEFLAVIDSDDIAHPDRLALQVAYLQQYPAVVWVGGAFELIDERGYRLTCLPLPETDAEIRDLLAHGNMGFLHPTAMMRRDAVAQLGGYDETLPLAEDLDLWLRLSQVGQLGNLPLPVVQYRIHPASICDRHREAPPAALQTVLDRAWHQGILTKPIQAITVCGWRPGTDPQSQYDFLLKYGWWAFNYRQRKAALHYGLRAIAFKPLFPDSWKLLICAAIKPLPI